MKELSIEQKAQRYGEVLKEAVVAHKDEDNKHLKATLERIFPELKERESEKMVKFIKQQLFNIKKTITENYELDTKLTKAIDWLEKQNEQTKIEALRTEYEKGRADVLTEAKLEPKFKVGDWVIVSTTQGDRVVQIDSVEYFKDGHPSYFTTEGRWFGNGTKARLLTDKDVETITIPESKVIVNQNPAWSEEDEKMVNDIIAAIDTLYYHGMVNWLNSLKERVHPQPKQEWKQENTDDLTDFENAMRCT